MGAIIAFGAYFFFGFWFEAVRFNIDEGEIIPALGLAFLVLGPVVLFALGGAMQFASTRAREVRGLLWAASFWTLAQVVYDLAFFGTDKIIGTLSGLIAASLALVGTFFWKKP